MQLNLILGNTNIEFNTEDNYECLWDKLEDDVKISSYRYAHGCQIYTNKIKLIWEKLRFDTLKIFLNLWDKDDKAHNSIIIENENGEKEVINLYNFITQLMIIYNKNKEIYLGDIKESLSNLWMSVNNDNLAVITRQRFVSVVNTHF